MELKFIDVAPADPAMAGDLAPLIRELRPGLGQQEFEDFAAEAHGQGAVFTAAYDGEGRCVAAACHRVLATSRGRLMFVDDLVTDPGCRSGGVGARLLDELEARGRRAGCVRLELDSGVTNNQAHRFYHARRLSITAIHFARDLSTP